MNYVSTRGSPDRQSFLTAAMSGLASDGGLFHPERWPAIEPPSPGEAYADVAARCLGAFIGDELSDADVETIAAAAYRSFAHESVAPLLELAPDRWLLQLHHGPSLAFKDVAMQAIAKLYDTVLGRRGDRLTVLCATSGDTGGAAATAFAGLDQVDVVILHPHGRISPVQRKFMTSTGAANVVNLALDGDFDNCQRIVKALLADPSLVSEYGLAAVNSINWVRIAAQSVYFAQAQARLGHGAPIQWVVPSGNFGDALAGYVAHRCGLVPRFRCCAAVNRNDAVHRLISGTGFSRRETEPSLSPAMDIQVPSNFERLLFEALDRDGDQVRAFYASAEKGASTQLPTNAINRIRDAGFSSVSISDAATLDEIAMTFAGTGEIVCPHTAVGLRASRDLSVADGPIVTLATAHASKFPDTVSQALGFTPTAPHRAHEILHREENFVRGPGDEAFVRGHISKLRLRRGG